MFAAFLLNVTPLRTAQRHSSKTCHLFRHSHSRFRPNTIHHGTSFLRPYRSRVPIPHFSTVSLCASATVDDKTTSNLSHHNGLHPAVKRHFSLGFSVVVLRSGKARYFLDKRATTVYSGAIREVSNNAHMNSIVVVLDASYRRIGYGVYNPKSLFRVRLLYLVDNNKKIEEHDDDDDDVKWNIQDCLVQLLERAVNSRRLMGLPNISTNAYRVVNADGDGLSGLFVDRFAHVAVISSCAMWTEAFRQEIEHAVKTVLETDGVKHIVWRPNYDRLKQDGNSTLIEKQKESESQLKTNHRHNNETQSSSSTSTLTNNENNNNTNDNDVVVALEEDIKFALPSHVLRTGQKTGHYADQRDARLYLRSLLQRSAKSSVRVLDLFCYSGGFALNALQARDDIHVTAIDSSETALSLLRQNAKLNGFDTTDAETRLEIIRADATKKISHPQHSSFDIVIVDPPKLAPNARVLPRALGKYRRINEAAIRFIQHQNNGGGLLISCSCSAAVAQRRSLLVDEVRNAAAECGRQVTLLKTFGAGLDHPIHADMLETEYLTVCVFSVR